MTPFEKARDAIDRANGEDPEGRGLDYGRRMAEWAARLAPEASEELLVAARAQHLRRWTVPRSTYPEGRAGYFAWREGLKKFHADGLASILTAAGVGEPSIVKARALLLRKHLASDPEGQTLEDAACLVFLETEFAAFSSKTDPDKMVDILRKTWGKMSPVARDLALTLPLPTDLAALDARALGS